MKYEHEQGWTCEIVGASNVPIADLDVLYSVANVEGIQALINKVVVASSFPNDAGESVDARDNWRRLSFRQYKWLRLRILEAAINEVADPEA